jgi:hypothetical protein
LLQLLTHPLTPDDDIELGVARREAPEAGLPRAIPINEPYIPQRLSPSLGDQAIITLHTYRRTAPNYFLSDRYADAWRPALRELVLSRLGAESDALSEHHSLRDPLLIIKEPNGSLGADLVMSLFPSSRLIFLLRDGRDVVDSMVDAQAPGAWLGSLREGANATGQSDRLAIVDRESWLWVARTEAVQRAYQAHAPDRRLTVRYEDLRADASRSLATLDDWLGLGRGAQWRSSAIRWNDFESYPVAARGPGMPLRSATPGLWQTNLTAEEQAVMEDIMGAKLREFGYEPRAAGGLGHVQS